MAQAAISPSASKTTKSFFIAFLLFLLVRSPRAWGPFRKTTDAFASPCATPLPPVGNRLSRLRGPPSIDTCSGNHLLSQIVFGDVNTVRKVLSSPNFPAGQRGLPPDRRASWEPASAITIPAGSGSGGSFPPGQRWGDRCYDKQHNINRVLRDHGGLWSGCAPPPSGAVFPRTGLNRVAIGWVYPPSHCVKNDTH